MKQIGRNELLPAGVIITGGGSGIPFIADLAKNALHLPSRIGYPSFGSDPQKPNVESGMKAEMINVPAWTVAYGLCIIGFSSDKSTSEGTSIVKKATGSVVNFFGQFLP